MGKLSLDALDAEVNGEPFEFEHDGELYSLPPRMDMLAVAALSEGDIGVGLRRLLGKEQWQRIMDSDRVLDDRKAALLFEAYTQHMGTSVGELSASTVSSPSTARR